MKSFRQIFLDTVSKSYIISSVALALLISCSDGNETHSKNEKPHHSKLVQKKIFAESRSKEKGFGKTTSIHEKIASRNLWADREEAAFLKGFHDYKYSKDSERMVKNIQPDDR